MRLHRVIGLLVLLGPVGGDRPARPHLGRASAPPRPQTQLMAEARGDAASLESGGGGRQPAGAAVPVSWNRVLAAYLLWLLFPLTGLHHLYLGRNRAALLSSVSCGHFGVGWLCDAFRIPGYASELACAEAADAAAAAATGDDGWQSKRAAEAAATSGSRAAAKPPGPVRLLRILCTQLLLALWLFYHASRLLPQTVSSHAVSWVGGASAAVAVWLSVTGGLSGWASSMWALLPVACSGLASVATSALLHIEWPHPAEAAATPSLRLQPALPPLIVGVGVANLIAPRCNALRKEQRTCAPRRSLLATAGVAVASLLFWGAVLAGWLMRLPVEVSADGRTKTMDTWRLLVACSCVGRPDRLYNFVRQGFREPVCIKRELVAVLGPFERFCFMPQATAINKCFDWDIFDTRWARVGLTVSEAYRVLEVNQRSSTREVKAAYHRVALANHPDKVKNVGSADALEAADKFMKVQKAFETVMESRKKVSNGI